jgi:hypothetical protein
MIWDGIRAVDYLMTRREVDPLRIGITDVPVWYTIGLYCRFR